MKSPAALLGAALVAATLTAPAASATGYVKATALGRVAYRYYVPAHTWRGLPVAATYSRQFVVTTIP